MNLKNSYKKLPIIHELHVMAGMVSALESEVRARRMAASAIELERLRETKGEREGPLSLHRAEFQVCSQNGEDGVIREIFRRIGTSNRFFAEFGVANGVECNTAFLYSQGWSGIWIDGNPEAKATATKISPKGELVCRLAYVTAENAAELLREAGCPTEPDLLSLDIDQNTYYLWAALGAVRARVIVVEYNASLPPDCDWVCQYSADKVWDGTLNTGASLKAFERLGSKFGYKLVHCEAVGSNAFFVRDDLVGSKFLGPFDAETHHEPPRFSLIHVAGHARSIPDRSDYK